MEQDISNKILKGLAFTGGGTVAGLATNKLLGNDSLKSKIISGLIGTSLGLGAHYLNSTDKDFSNNPISKAMENIRDNSNKSSDVSWFTTPFTAPFQVWGGGDTDEAQRPGLRQKLLPLLGKGTKEQQQETYNRLAQLALDDAADERQLDAILTSSGGLAGGVGGFLGGRAWANRLYKKDEVARKTLRKLVKELPIGDQKAMESIAKSINGTSNPGSILSSKDWWKSWFKRNGATLRQQSQQATIKDLLTKDMVTALGTKIGTQKSPKITEAQVDTARQAIRLLKDRVRFGRLNPNSYSKLMKSLKGAPGWLKATGIIGGTLTGALGVAGITNYAGSRDHYNNIKNSLNN